MSVRLILLVHFAYRLVGVARRLRVFLGFLSVLIPKSLLSLESYTSIILAVKSFECGIDDVSVGNFTRGELATA